MHNAPKPKKIYESIEDGSFVNQAMQDIVDLISPEQLKELDKAISEADKGDTIFLGGI